MIQNLTFPSRGSSYGPFLWPTMVSVTSSPYFFPVTLQCLGAGRRIKVGIFCFFVNVFMKLSASTALTVLVWAVLFIKNKDLIKKTYCFFHFYCPNFCENLMKTLIITPVLSPLPLTHFVHDFVNVFEFTINFCLFVRLFVCRSFFWSVCL